MKKYIAILASTALIAVLAVSCGNMDEALTSVRLKSYSENMVKQYVINPVLTINESAFKHKDIFKDGFTVTKKGKYTISLLSAIDSTWFYVQTSDNKGYVVSGIIRLLPDNAIGLHMWECSAEVTYDEGNGYASVLRTVNPAEFYWEDQLMETEYKYSIVFDGKFTIDTYLLDKHLDSGALTFYRTATGTVLSDSWDMTSYR